MTSRTGNDTHDPSPSLWAKLQAFADGLTPEERAQVRALQTAEGPNELLPSLRDKVQRATEVLAPDEQAQLHQLVRGADHDAASDTRGYMKPEYEDPFGWKGPPGTDPSLGEAAGGGIVGEFVRGTAAFLTGRGYRPPSHYP